MKIYCKNCKFYKGEVWFKRDYPMAPSKSLDYLCGKTNESVFRRNRDNDCKDFEAIIPSIPEIPLIYKISLRQRIKQKLFFWKHGQ